MTRTVKPINYLLLASLLFFGCAGDTAEDFSKAQSGADNDAWWGADAGANFDNSANNGTFVPVIEDEFEFAKPAVVGESVFIANETLNSVAVIDSKTLQITSIPVGFKPTAVGGPVTQAEDSKVFVLNEGSSSVTVINPETKDTETHSVLRRSNALRVGPRGRTAIAWYDDTLAEGPVPPEIDLVAITLIKADAAYQISVGFHVRSVTFSDDGTLVFIITDDGVSVLKPADIGEDGFRVPMPLMPFGASNPEDLETIISPDGKYVVTRSSQFSGAALLDVETGEYSTLHLPEIPTDLDWVAHRGALLTMPHSATGMIISLPDGFTNAAAFFAPTVDPPPMDMGADADMASDLGADMGSDTGMTDAGADMTDTGTDMADAGADMADTGTDMADTGTDMADTGADSGAEAMWPILEGVDFIEMPITGLGAAEVSPEGSSLLFFSTLYGEKRAVVVDQVSAAARTRTILFEKGIRGAIADPSGQSFVVMHTKEPGTAPAGSTPIDPEYIATSWAVSLLDVKASLSRLVLTENEPGELTVFSEDSRSMLFMAFKPTSSAKASERDIMVANLRSFATSSFRVAAPPEGLGPIEGEALIYISQKHPQGRITFVDVDTQERRAVTGYQLNAGID